MDDLINRTKAIQEMMDEDVDHVQGKSGREVIQILMDLPFAQYKKEYTKADFLMNLHKQYGCSFTRAEEAYQKALEYLQDKAMMG